MHVTYYNFLNLSKLKNSCKLQMFFDYLSNETNISIIRLNLIKPKNNISINVISKTVWKNYAVFEKWLFKIKIEWFLFFRETLELHNPRIIPCCSTFDERLEKIRTFSSRKNHPSGVYHFSLSTLLQFLSVLFLFLPRHVEYEHDKKKEKELEFNKRTAQKNFNFYVHFATTRNERRPP